MANSQTLATAVAVRAEGLTKRYRSGAAALTVFENLRLEVAEGERVAVTGESGTGKSTLLHLLGLLDAADAGSIYLGGRFVSDLTGDALAEVRNRSIGYVWQSNTLLPEFTALENVAMPLLIRSTSRTEAENAAACLLEEVGLAERSHHLAGELSGGEQQRVALSRALVGNPPILLADEPTGSLDAATGARILDLLEAIHRRRRLTTLYVTHNLEFASRADRILQLKAGALLDSRA